MTVELQQSFPLMPPVQHVSAAVRDNGDVVVLCCGREAGRGRTTDEAVGQWEREHKGARS